MDEPSFSPAKSSKAALKRCSPATKKASARKRERSIRAKIPPVGRRSFPDRGRTLLGKRGLFSSDERSACLRRESSARDPETCSRTKKSPQMGRFLPPGGRNGPLERSHRPFDRGFRGVLRCFAPKVHGGLADRRAPAVSGDSGQAFSSWPPPGCQ